MTLVYLATAWLVGIAASQSLGAPRSTWIAGAVILLAALIAFWRQPAARLGVSCLLLAALGGLRMSVAQPHFTEQDLAHYNGQGQVVIEGWIIDAPDERDAYTLLRVAADTITLEGQVRHPVQGIFLLQTARGPDFRYGQEIRATGYLTTPLDSDTFSYRDYLARQGIYSQMRYAGVDTIGSGRGSPVRAALLGVRGSAHQRIQEMLPDPQASLLAGILLGIETGISPEVREQFNRVGASHIIAISGSNMAILAGLLLSVTRRFLSLTWSTLITIAGVLGYGIFVGGDPGVMRAAIMATLGLVAALAGRQTYGLASLAFAALILTAINPKILGDVGFQLSFAATLGLILYVEPLRHGLDRVLSHLAISDPAQQVLGALTDGLIVTMAAQVMTAPIMAYHFQQLSLLSLPVNFLIVPVQPMLMVLGGLGVGLSALIEPVGQALAWASWLFLSYTLAIVRVAANLPFSATTIPSLSPVTIGGTYAALLSCTWFAMQPAAKRRDLVQTVGHAYPVKALTIAGILATALLTAAAYSMPDGYLHVLFMDVGDGQSTLVITPSGRHILIDAGGSGRQLAAELGDALPFWSRSLDIVILPRNSSAHISGLPEVFEHYRVDVMIADGPPGEGLIWAAIERDLQEQEARKLEVAAGTQINIDDGTIIEIIDAPSAGLRTDATDGGIVLKITHGAVSVLLPGAISPEQQIALLARYPDLPATVLVMPPGQQPDAASAALLTAVHPQFLVAAPGFHSDSSSYDESALAELAPTGTRVYRIDESGTIRLRTDGTRLWIRTSR